MTKAILICLALCLNAAPAAALTAEEIQQLKKNGVSDRIIELMLEQEIERQKKISSEPSVIDTGKSVIYSTGAPSVTPLTEQEQRDLDRAWRMLENMEIKVRQK